MRSKPLILLNSFVTWLPNRYPAPLGLAPQASISSGSLHIRSQKAPSWGISQTRSIVRICKTAQHTLMHDIRGYWPPNHFWQVFISWSKQESHVMSIICLTRQSRNASISSKNRLTTRSRNCLQVRKYKYALHLWLRLATVMNYVCPHTAAPLKFLKGSIRQVFLSYSRMKALASLHYKSKAEAENPDWMRKHAHIARLEGSGIMLAKEQKSKNTWSRVLRSGERPPWTHKILPSTIAYNNKLQWTKELKQ